VYTYEFAWCADGSSCSPSDTPAAVGDTTPRASYTPPWSTEATEVEVYREWWTSFPPPAAFANAAGWEPELLVSEPISVNRGLGACSGARLASAHGAGDWITCYQPSGSLPVHEMYACGNAPCVKLNDPALDTAALGTAVSEVLYMGLAIFAFFGLFLLCMCRKHGCSCRQFCCGDDDWSSSEEEAK
jgi:hypothetical protein